MRYFRLVVLIFLFSSSEAQTSQGSHSDFVWGDAHIHVYWYSNFSDAEKEKLANWLKHGLQMVRTLNGQLPRKKLRFHLQYKASNPSPVPYAQVLRDDVLGVHFWVDAQRSYYDLIRDWTFPHELVHLFLNYLGDEDAWINEGLSTYYQYILLVRSGLLEERYFWRRFIQGVERGKNDSDYDGYPLHLVSEHMRSQGGFNRVYWSGALFFLEANLMLLENESSLEMLISKYMECCQKSHEKMTGLMFMKKLDEISGLDWFEQRYEEYKYVSDMPSYQNSFEKMGVKVRGGQVLLEPENKLRRGVLYPSISTDSRQ